MKSQTVSVEILTSFLFVKIKKQIFKQAQNKYKHKHTDNQINKNNNIQTNIFDALATGCCPAWPYWHWHIHPRYLGYNHLINPHKKNYILNRLVAFKMFYWQETCKCLYFMQYSLLFYFSLRWQYIVCKVQWLSSYTHIWLCMTSTKIGHQI